MESKPRENCAGQLELPLLSETVPVEANRGIVVGDSRVKTGRGGLGRDIGWCGEESESRESEEQP